MRRGKSGMESRGNKGMSNEEKVLTVCFFGQFRILYDGMELTEDAIHSEMVTKLLAYILQHNRRILTVRELSDMLWGEDGGSDNPAGALKNLVYRLRNVLKKTYHTQEQFILTNLGSYCWNGEIAVSADAEEFEEKIKAAKAAADVEKSIAAYERAMELYQGRYLDKHCPEQWVVPLAAYYHSMFLSGVKTLAGLYEKQERYEEMETICARALQYDNLDEEIHYLVLRALVQQQKQNMALSHYEETVKLFYEALGVRELPKLKEIYEQILSMKKVSETVQTEEISQDVQEAAAPEGAYFCGYAVFRELYRIEARRVSRMGMSEYILMLTLSAKQGEAVAERAQRYMLNRAMDRMEGVLKGSLRIGDVASRYSDSQYLVLLPTCTYETGQMIARRIIGRFEKDAKNRKYQAKYHIEEVTAAGEEMYE